MGALAVLAEGLVQFPKLTWWLTQGSPRLPPVLCRHTWGHTHACRHAHIHIEKGKPGEGGGRKEKGCLIGEELRKLWECGSPGEKMLAHDYEGCALSL